MTKAPGGPLLVGLITADFGLILIALAGWHALWTKAQAIMHSASGLLCCAGLILIWIGTTKLAESTHGQTDRIQGATGHRTRIPKPD